MISLRVPAMLALVALSFSNLLPAAAPGGEAPRCGTGEAQTSEPAPKPARIYPVVVDGNLGFMDRQGGAVIEPQFSLLMIGGSVRFGLEGHDYRHDRLPRDRELPWGLNEYFYGFSDGVGMVCREQRFGFVDQNGTTIIPPQFEIASDFRDGRAWVGCGGKCALINRRGEKLISGLDRVHWFSEGLAAVKIGDQWGFIDRSGELVIPPRFELAGPERYGGMDPGPPVFHEGIAMVWENGKAGLIDRRGTYVAPPQFDDIWPFFGDRARVTMGGKLGFIDRRGRVVIEAAYERLCCRFAEGLASVEIEGKDGCIDLLGNLVIAPKFDLIASFAEGLACAKVGERFGYIDHQGHLVIQPQYARAGDFQDGLAIVVAETGKHGVIDQSGQFVVPAQYDNIEPFSSGLAVVCAGDRFGAVNKLGHLVIEPKYDRLDSFQNRQAIAVLGGKLGLIDATGRWIVPPRFSWVDSTIVGNRRLVQVEYKFGYLDGQGRMVIPPKFDYAERFDGGIARVGFDVKPPFTQFHNVSEGRWGYIDDAGNWIWEPTE